MAAKKRDILQTPVDAVTFTFIDVETTGLNPWFGEKICEVGLLKVKGKRTLSTFHTLINPRRRISPGALAVNGITDEMVASAPTFDKVVDSVLEFIDDTVMVAHNAPFDLGFLAHQLRSMKLPPLENKVIDTLYLARRYYSFPSNSLPNIASYLGLKTRTFHRALQDCIATKGIFDKFLRAFRKEGVNRLNELLELQGGSISFPQLPDIILPPELEEVIENNEMLEIKYVSANGYKTVRIIEPKEVNAYKDNVYLVAYCHMRKEDRTFRLDRIVGMKPHNL